MIEWNNVTWYSQAIAILLAVTIFYVGFSVGSIDLGEDKQDVLEISETARLGSNSVEVKLLTNTVLNTRNFVFLGTVDNNIIDVLTVANDRLGPPDYKIVTGNSQDWLLVRRIEGSGTGYIEYADDWYTLSGGAKIVLTYRSKSVMSPYPFSESQFNEHLSTEVSSVSSDDQLINVQTTKKICEQIMGGEDGPCTEATYKDTYQWNNELSEFSKVI